MASKKETEKAKSKKQVADTGSPRFHWWSLPSELRSNILIFAYVPHYDLEVESRRERRECCEHGWDCKCPWSYARSSLPNTGLQSLAGRYCQKANTLHGFWSTEHGTTKPLKPSSQTCTLVWSTHALRSPSFHQSQVVDSSEWNTSGLCRWTWRMSKTSWHRDYRCAVRN